MKHLMITSDKLFLFQDNEWREVPKLVKRPFWLHRRKVEVLLTGNNHSFYAPDTLNLTEGVRRTLRLFEKASVKPYADQPLDGHAVCWLSPHAAHIASYKNGKLIQTVPFPMQHEWATPVPNTRSILGWFRSFPKRTTRMLLCLLAFWSSLLLSLFYHQSIHLKAATTPNPAPSVSENHAEPLLTNYALGLNQIGKMLVNIPSASIRQLEWRASEWLMSGEWLSHHAEIESLRSDWNHFLAELNVLGSVSIHRSPLYGNVSAGNTKPFALTIRPR